jgi:hypothetical protein
MPSRRQPRRSFEFNPPFILSNQVVLRVITEFARLSVSRVEPVRAVKRYYGRLEPLPFRNFSAGYYEGCAWRCH